MFHNLPSLPISPRMRLQQLGNSKPGAIRPSQTTIASAASFIHDSLKQSIILMSHITIFVDCVAPKSLISN